VEGTWETRGGNLSSPLLSSVCGALTVALSAWRQISSAQKCHWTLLINSFMQSPLQDLAYDITTNRAEKYAEERISVMPSFRLNLEQVYCRRVFFPR